MSLVQPFRALRPLPEKASHVSAPPYDVINREEARKLSQGNALSFLHVSRPEIDMSDDVDVHSSAVYEKALENFEKLARSAPLVREEKASLYIYRLTMNGREQTGIAATFSIDEYDRGLIKKHEKTRQDKEDDRTRHVVTLKAQTGPVFLTYRGNAAIDALVEREKVNPALFDFTSADGIRHTVWRAQETENIVGLLKDVPALYIADGHHRAASASRARGEISTRSGAENFVLAVAFPSEQLKIFPYYRVIRDLNGRTPEQTLKSVGERFIVQENASEEPKRGQFSMYLNGAWYGLTPKSSPRSASPTARLDVSVLQEQLLEPIFGIKDPRTDSRIDFVGGIRGTGELKRLVDSGKASVAFSLHPTTVEDLMAISDAGEIMPPKSTWFEPKLRDGLLSHVLGD